MKTLVLFAHPRPDRSEVNTPLFRAAATMPGVTAVDLYASYPDFDIDVAREQARLAAHDALVLQHPLYWYAAPALLKEWLDLVLEHGWAYGHAGNALDGKIALSAVTTGAPARAYCPPEGAGLRQLLAPFEMSLRLCGMRYLAPFALFEAGRARADGRLGAHLAAWRTLLAALTTDTLDLSAAEAADLMTDLPALGPEAVA